jgi:hypothetical protein
MDKVEVFVSCTETLCTDACAICMVFQCAGLFPLFIDHDQRIPVVFHNVVGHMKFISVFIDSELLQ